MEWFNLRIVCDIEANALVNPDKLWCLCAKDIDTGERYKHTVEEPDYLLKIKELLERADEIIGHNFIAYDRVVINSLVGYLIPLKKITDTLVLSRLIKPIRDGGHSLERWGRFFKKYKKHHEEWDRFSPEMLERCEGDVEINAQLYTYLLNEGKGFSRRSIRLEHQVALILHRVQEQGFALDVEATNKLYQTCSARAQVLFHKIQSEAPALPKRVREVTFSVTKSGRLPSRLQKLGIEGIEGLFTLIKWQELDLNSPKQVVRYLNYCKWKPTIKTKAGSPKICEENLDTLPDTAPETAKLIKEYLICNSRANAIKNWLDNTGPDNRVHGKIFHIGAHTHRAGHRNPNTANIPGVKDKKGRPNLYGPECRSCWVVFGDDRRLVGVDAKGIQLRILAHLINSKEFTDVLLNGDPHQVNADALGITRPNAKTFIYAYLLGAGDAKVGSIVGKGSNEGSRIKDAFLQKWPGLKKVRAWLQDCAHQGYMVMPDGRRIAVENAHYGMGVALQGIESIIMKQAMVLWYSEARRRKLDAFIVAWVHDEFQIDCHKDCVVEAADLMVQCIIKAGEMLHLNCPMDGEYKIGMNWKETH